MNTCKDCKHWQSNIYLKSVGSWMEGEDKIPENEITEWGQCGAIGLPIRGCTTHLVKAFVQDGSDYMGVLNTHQDFGCTAFETK